MIIFNFFLKYYFIFLNQSYYKSDNLLDKVFLLKDKVLSKINMEVNIDESVKLLDYCDDVNYFYNKKLKYGCSLLYSLLFSYMSSVDKFTSSVLFARKSLRLNPVNESLWLHLGFLLGRMQDIKGSINAFRKSLSFARIKSNNEVVADSMFGMGIGFYLLNNFELSKKYLLYSESVNLKLKRVEQLTKVYYQLGSLFKKNNNKKISLFYFNKALEIVNDVEVKNEILEEINKK